MKIEVPQRTLYFLTVAGLRLKSTPAFRWIWGEQFKEEVRI